MVRALSSLAPPHAKAAINGVAVAWQGLKTFLGQEGKAAEDR